jgi:receptor protein-tyrosine kinase
MSALLEQQRERFDLIIIDTPPLLPVTDAAVVAAKADGAVVVTRSGKTTQAQIRAAMASLRAIDTRVLGCVLNMQPHKGGNGYYYTYNYAYRREVPSQVPTSVAVTDLLTTDDWEHEESTQLKDAKLSIRSSR